VPNTKLNLGKSTGRRPNSRQRSNISSQGQGEEQYFNSAPRTLKRKQILQMEVKVNSNTHDDLVMFEGDNVEEIV
jgi:hypothetical protein